MRLRHAREQCCPEILRTPAAGRGLDNNEGARSDCPARVAGALILRPYCWVARLAVFMADLIINDADSVPAGAFGSWLAQARAALRGNGGTEVPCGDCTGCCTSGYSVQLRPEDKPALAVIPAELLVSAPGFHSEHKTMAALPNGHCPMLTEGRCSIYRHRPQTCLDYDCRIFAAAGIDAGGADKTVINRRVRAWRFDYPTQEDERAHRAVLDAATFIREHSAAFTVHVPTGPMGVAVLALKVYTLFLDPGIQTRKDRDIADDIVRTSRAFDR